MLSGATDVPNADREDFTEDLDAVNDLYQELQNHLKELVDDMEQGLQIKDQFQVTYRECVWNVKSIIVLGHIICVL